jgi:hypothetical protein
VRNLAYRSLFCTFCAKPRRFLVNPKVVDHRPRLLASVGSGAAQASVRFGLKADISGAKTDVRFTPESRQQVRGYDFVPEPILNATGNFNPEGVM